MAIKILLHATLPQQEQWSLKSSNENVELIFYRNEVVEADVYIDNVYEGNKTPFRYVTTKPVLINTYTLYSENLSNNFFSFNGWITSIVNKTIECGGTDDYFVSALQKICLAANWQLFFFKDIIGLPTQRTIAMIVNEAYFALEANVSTKHDIDVAMKLGTNYPYGPFEWGKKIGLQEIYNLLTTLSTIDKKFTPCKLLELEVETEN
jgi:3-hydroxybutyryl-CoA dehydrogenase